MTQEYWSGARFASHAYGCRAFLRRRRPKGETGRTDLELLLRAGAFDVVTVTPQQAENAISAFRRGGRGRRPPALNIGDCFSYALAVATDDSLLFKGNDFAPTVSAPHCRGQEHNDPQDTILRLYGCLNEGREASRCRVIPASMRGSTP